MKKGSLETKVLVCAFLTFILGFGLLTLLAAQQLAKMTVELRNMVEKFKL